LSDELEVVLATRGGRHGGAVVYEGNCGDGTGEEEKERVTPSRSFGEERSPLATEEPLELPAFEDDESFLSFCLHNDGMTRISYHSRHVNTPKPLSSRGEIESRREKLNEDDERKNKRFRLACDSGTTLE